MDPQHHQSHQQHHDNADPADCCPFLSARRHDSSDACFQEYSHGQHRQATGVVPGPLMAVFPGAHMQGMYAVPVMIPAQPLTQATLNYTWANPYTRGMEPQPTEMLQPLWHYPGNTMYQPHLLLDQLQPSCPVDNGGSGSKLVHSDGHVQVKVPGHLMAKNMSQNAERNNQDIPSDLEPFPACGRDFAKTLSKVMTKTSDRLMALLEAELDRLDKLDAASEASGAVQDVNIKPGIKPEGNSGQNDELDSPGTESDKADEEPPILNEVGSRPQTSDEPKKFHRVTMTDEQQERNTVAGRPLSSNVPKLDANRGRGIGSQNERGVNIPLNS